MKPMKTKADNKYEQKQTIVRTNNKTAGGTLSETTSKLNDQKYRTTKP